MNNSKVLYTVEESLQCNGGILPLSKSAVYKLIRERKIPSHRIGKRVFILGTYLRSIMMEAPPNN